jgi:endonuclease V-like protein UPF0215 family
VSKILKSKHNFSSNLNESKKAIKLRQIKKEIRILALTASKLKDTTYIIGAVFKGKQGLDGVLSTNTKAVDLTKPILQMIQNSIHRNQIRIILIDRQHLPRYSKIRPFTLSEVLNKPIIFLNWTDTAVNFYWKRIPILSIKISKNESQQVLDKLSLEPCLPEPLRVSEIILTALLNSA